MPVQDIAICHSYFIGYLEILYKNHTNYWWGISDCNRRAFGARGFRLQGWTTNAWKRWIELINNSLAVLKGSGKDLKLGLVTGGKSRCNSGQ